jgi:hypothetical protein
MQESYGEGVASHAGPESCAGVREGVGEALTGGGAGRVLSREIHDPLRGADVLEDGGRPHRRRLYREAQPDPAVRDPEHAPNHLAREPGDPAFVCGRGGLGTLLRHGRGASVPRFYRIAPGYQDISSRCITRGDSRH